MNTLKNREAQRTEKTEIWMGEEGIIWMVYFKPNTVIEMDDVIANQKINQSLYDGTPSLFLVDIRNVKSTNREVRQHGVSEDTIKRTGAMAILVDSLLTKSIGNVYMKLTKPPYPTQMFLDEDRAIEWLLKFKI